MLSAVPLSALYEVFLEGAGAVIHVLFATGFALIASSVFDFGAAQWLNRIARTATSVLAAIFFLQGISEVVQTDRLTHLAYQVLGQRLETWLVDIFLLWCAGVVLIASEGKTRILGLIALAITIGLQAYGHVLSYLGTSLDAQSQGLKVLFLLPFVWMLFESMKARQSGLGLDDKTLPLYKYSS